MIDPDHPLEQLLRRYRPAGPGGTLRDRVLQAASLGQGPSAPRTGLRLWPLSAAAVWLLCCGLWIECSRLDRGIAQALAAKPAATAETREFQALLGGDSRARRYIQLALSTRGPLPDPSRAREPIGLHP